MKILKDLSLIAMGAIAVIVYERYSADMLQMVKDFVDEKACQCYGLED